MDNVTLFAVQTSIATHPGHEIVSRSSAEAAGAAGGDVTKIGGVGAVSVNGRELALGICRKVPREVDGSREGGEETLVPPKTSQPTLRSTAVNRSEKLLVAASTSTILAFGAIACAHSMSWAASCPQPQLALGWEPEAKTFLKHGAVLL